MGEYSLLDYRFYLDIITSILFVILCIDCLKNRFPKMNKTRKLIILPFVIIIMLYNIYRIFGILFGL